MKTKTTHTPGPWFASEEIARGGHYGNREQPSYIGVGNGAVAVARVNVTGTTQDTYRANARLIAAAPDLLVAARLAMESMDEFLIDGQSIGNAAHWLRAAIAYAEGE